MTENRARQLIQSRESGISADELISQIADQTIVSEGLAQFGSGKGFYKDGSLTEKAITILKNSGFSSKRIASMTLNEALLILRNGGVPLESMKYSDAVLGIKMLSEALLSTKSQDRSNKLLRTIVELASSAINSSREGISKSVIDELSVNTSHIIKRLEESLQEAYLDAGELAYMFDNEDDVPDGVGRIKFLVSELSRTCQRLDNKLNGR